MMSRYRSFNEFRNSYATLYLNYDDSVDILFGGDNGGSLKGLSSLEVLNFGRNLINLALYEMNERNKILELEKEKDDGS